MFNIEDIARVCHETNRTYCSILGDHSHVPWDEAPEWQKQSCIDGVRFHINNPDLGPEDSHNNWMRHKMNDGWVYGQTKDATLKTHPCMVPYRDLPMTQRIKDALFKKIVDSLRRLIDE